MSQELLKQSQEKLAQGESEDLFQVIGVIGLGYVGLPLAMRFAEVGIKVIGFDIDPAKVEALNLGRSYICHISPQRIQIARAVGKFEATTDFSRVKETEAILICVPTPLTRHREPDLSYVMNTGKTIAEFLRPGQLVVLESTTYPGTTEEDLRKVLEEGSGLKAGQDFYLAFSPEREDPGNPASDVALIPKVVGGYTKACLERACALYSKAVKKVVPVSSCRVAEAAKLLENIFRSVNIALVNELKMVFDAMGIDIWEVIEAAKTKPFGFMPFYPGPGLGGHCIPIDPFYLTWKAREYDVHTRFIELAGEINSYMPFYVVSKVGEALNAMGKPFNGSKILVLGLAYKADVDDDRESPSYVLIDLLRRRGASVDYYDPYIPVVKPSRKHAHLAGMRSIEWNQKAIEKYDVVLISTAHSCVNYAQLVEWARCIVDTRNVMVRFQTKPGQVWKA